MRPRFLLGCLFGQLIPAGFAPTAVLRTSAAPAATNSEAVADQAWRRHTIDDSSLGADGVRLGELNGDGVPDFTAPSSW